MKFINHLFVDHVSGENVCLFEDKFGRKYMAENKWSLFRVKVSST